MNGFRTKQVNRGWYWQRRTRIAILGMTLLLAIMLAGCDLDTRSIPPWVKAEVHPSLVCPGDIVVVDWEMGVSSGGCLGGSGVGGSADDELRECRGYATILSSPNIFVPPAPSDHHTGIEYVSVSGTTTFTFNGRHDGLDWPEEVRTVDVIASAALTTTTVTFEGVCTGTTPAWAPVEVLADSSEFVQVEGVCNPNSFPVRVNSSALGRSAPLGPGMCTNDLDGKPGTLSAFPEGISPLVTEADCSPTRAIPPVSLQLEVGLRCSAGSISEAIVAGTPEATEEEPATFVTNTPPPPTPTLAPISVNFNSDAYNLLMGECTTLRWEALNADAVMLDGVPVPSLEAESVCPPVTTIYKIVANNPSETVERFVTIEVTQSVVLPEAPGQLGITNQICTDKAYSVTISWIDTADNEDGYRVYRDGNLLATLGPGATSYTDSPPYGGPYTYSLEAFNSAGSSPIATVQELGCIY